MVAEGTAAGLLQPGANFADEVLDRQASAGVGSLAGGWVFRGAGPDLRGLLSQGAAPFLDGVDVPAVLPDEVAVEADLAVVEDGLLVREGAVAHGSIVVLAYESEVAGGCAQMR